MSAGKFAKIAVVAIAPIALGYSVWQFVQSGKGPLPDSWLMVDVTTGKMRSVGQDNLLSVPAKNDAGEFTLLRVEKDPSGHYVIVERDRPALKELFASQKSVKVDPTTYRVTQ